MTSENDIEQRLKEGNVLKRDVMDVSETRMWMSDGVKMNDASDV